MHSFAKRYTRLIALVVVVLLPSFDVPSTRCDCTASECCSKLALTSADHCCCASESEDENDFYDCIAPSNCEFSASNSSKHSCKCPCGCCENVRAKTVNVELREGQYDDEPLVSRCLSIYACEPSSFSPKTLASERQSLSAMKRCAILCRYLL